MAECTASKQRLGPEVILLTLEMFHEKPFHVKSTLDFLLTLKKGGQNLK